MSTDKHQQVLEDASSKVNPSSLPTPDTSTGDLTEDKATPQSKRMKAKQELRLPSFRSLGIAAPHPSALLTPPDENTLRDLPSAPTSTTNHPRSLSFPQAALPKTPDLVDLNTAPIQAVEGVTPKGLALTMNEPQDTVTPTGKGRAGSAIDNTIVVDQATWASKAIEVAITASITPGRNVVNVLCHSQPCPLPTEGSPTTVFNDLMSTLQTQIDPSTYIEVTHAVPLRFNMGQVPNSPAVTPNPHSNQPSTDYFSMQTFSKAVVAAEYQDALETSVPSSPHPVVAPSTVNIALLERYFPPSSSNEYHDLFSTEAPSALVNRLTELSSNNGTLLFIYPTSTGASAFAHHYLSPLLDPLLRTLAGVHNLASDLAFNVAKMAAIEGMLPFDGMTRKLNQLLRKLARPTGSRPPPTFKIVHSSAQKVILDRRSWTDWWIHQETKRIQGIVKRYFQRGYRLPTGEAATSGALCREILDGVRSRGYPQNGWEGATGKKVEGVEVGVFVVQRSA
ncbi:MAG: hypothetical protein Q9164_004142 [Protoblastenia rupestris]